MQRYKLLSVAATTNVISIWQSMRNNKCVRCVKRVRSKLVTGVNNATEMAIRHTIYQNHIT